MYTKPLLAHAKLPLSEMEQAHVQRMCGWLWYFQPFHSLLVPLQPKTMTSDSDVIHTQLQCVQHGDATVRVACQTHKVLSSMLVYYSLTHITLCRSYDTTELHKL